MYQRSGDIGLGVPFNVASYSFLTHILAKHCDLEAHEFTYFLGNAHIYNEHIEPLQEQITRTPYDFPSLEITKKYENINDYKVEDVTISNYQTHPTIYMKMIV